MFVRFPVSVWNSNCLEEAVTNASHLCETKFQMGYPLSFLEEGVQSNKQKETNKNYEKFMTTPKTNAFKQVKQVRVCSCFITSEVAKRRLYVLLLLKEEKKIAVRNRRLNPSISNPFWHDAMKFFITQFQGTKIDIAS